MENVFTTAYAETSKFYADWAAQMGDQALGYKILYGPPVVGAPILFLGYQPGGGPRDALEGEAAGERHSWPNEVEYANAAYSLAIRMREIWNVDTLRNSVGLNCMFFRAPNQQAWKAAPKQLRYAAQEFCKPQLRAMVEILRPRSIMMFGFGNIADFRPEGEPLRAAHSRLVQPGLLWGIPATEVIHLSGARISNPNRNRIASWFRRQTPQI